MGRCEYRLVWDYIHVGRCTYGRVCEWAGEYGLVWDYVHVGRCAYGKVCEWAGVSQGLLCLLGTHAPLQVVFPSLVWAPSISAQMVSPWAPASPHQGQVVLWERLSGKP